MISFEMTKIKEILLDVILPSSLLSPLLLLSTVRLQFQPPPLFVRDAVKNYLADFFR